MRGLHACQAQGPHCAASPLQASSVRLGQPSSNGALIESSASAAFPAVAIPAGAPLQQQQQEQQPYHPELDIHRVADAEQLLEELDACGVSLHLRSDFYTAVYCR